MIKIAICDDDVKELQEYKEIIRCCFGNANDVEKVMIQGFTSGEELWFQLYEKDFYHIYALDIELGEERMTGLETAKKVKEIQQDAIIIFLTQHLKYAISGYRYAAFRFVNKKKVDNSLSEAILEAYKQLKKKEDKFLTCRRYNDYIRIPYCEILFIYKNGQYYEITLKDQSVIREKGGIEQLFDSLKDERFVWIDRKSFINLDYLKRIEDGKVILIDGSIHETSKAKLKALQDILFEQWNEQRN